MFAPDVMHGTMQDAMPKKKGLQVMSLAAHFY